MPWMVVGDLPLNGAGNRYMNNTKITDLLAQFGAWQGPIAAGGNNLSDVGIISLRNGSPGVPSLALVEAISTGLYRPTAGSNTIGISANGVDRVQIGFTLCMRIRDTQNGAISELLRLLNDGAVANTSSALTFYHGANQKNARIRSIAVGANQGDLVFATGNGTDFVDRAALLNTGVFGIGTLAPLRALHMTRIGPSEALNGIMFSDQSDGGFRSTITPNFTSGSTQGNKLEVRVCDATLTGSSLVMSIRGSGHVIQAAPANTIDAEVLNSQFTWRLISDTSFELRVRGTDGVMRTRQFVLA